MTRVPENPINNLTPEQQQEAKLNYLRLFSFLNQAAANFADGRMLVSRGSTRQLLGTDEAGNPRYDRIPTAWEGTGLHTDPSAERVYAKVGNHEYQAIGWIFDDMLVLSDVSKVLWEREFAYMSPVPTAVPFKAEEVPMDEAFKLEKEEERKRLEEGVKELDELYEAYLKAYARKDTRQKVYEDDVRAGIVIWSMRIPALDTVLKSLVEAHPSIKPSLDGPGADMKEIAPNVLTWMKMKIQNIELEIHQKTIRLIPQAADHPATILLQSAEKALTLESREAVIRRYWQTFPETLPQAEEVDLEVIFPQMVEDLQKRLSTPIDAGAAIPSDKPKEELTLEAAKDGTFCGRPLSPTEKVIKESEEAALLAGIKSPPEPT